MKKLLPLLPLFLFVHFCYSQSYYYNMISLKKEDVEKLKKRKIAIVNTNLEEKIFEEFNRFTPEIFKSYCDFNSEVDIYNLKTVRSADVKKYIFIIPAKIIDGNGAQSFSFNYKVFSTHFDLVRYIEGTEFYAKNEFGQKLPRTIFNSPNTTLSEIGNAFRYYNAEFHRIEEGKKAKDIKKEHFQNTSLLKNKTLFIRDSDTKLSIDEIKSIYPYKIEIVSDEKIETAIAKKEKGIAIWEPADMRNMIWSIEDDKSLYYYNEVYNNNALGISSDKVTKRRIKKILDVIE